MCLWKIVLDFEFCTKLIKQHLMHLEGLSFKKNQAIFR